MASMITNTECALCQKPNRQMRLVNKMREHSTQQCVYDWLLRNEPTIEGSAQVCLPCVKQIQRNSQNPDFNPRWRPKRQVSKKCCIENCHKILYTHTKLASISEIESFIGHRVHSFTSDGDNTLVGLCKEHYEFMYSRLHPNKACDSCGEKPKKNETFNRHCPSPSIINDRLNQISAEQSNLTTTSVVCMSCYRHFQSLLRQPDTKNHTSDVNLDTIGRVIVQKSDILSKKGHNLDNEEFLEMILYDVAQTLLGVMRSDEAMLLPQLYRDYTRKIHTQAQMYPHVTPDIRVPSRRWLLSRLHALFGESLIMVCKHGRYGTLLYYTQCDVVKALSTALGRRTTHSVTDSAISQTSENSKTNMSLETQMENVSSDLNKRVHEQAKRIIMHYKDKPHKYKSFDLSAYIEMLDPVLLNFIKLLTQTVRSKRRLFETDTNHTKQIRQLFLLSSILFCTNVQCSMPLHTLVTEATLCHGGTQELVKIMNRLGVGSSIDTNQRLATQVVHARIVQGILPELNRNALSIVSVDNIDILQTHAFVSSTDGSRSWHGTSVQCVQPLPETGILQSDELTQPLQESSRKHCATSPTSSPALVEKSKRRKRALSSPHSEFVKQGLGGLPSSYDSSTYNSSTISLSLQDFKPNHLERKAWDILQEDVFKCMLLKQEGHSQLPVLQSLINCVRQQSTNTEESKVVYVHILSERADSRPTLISILSKMYQTFVIEQNQKWLLVVGDAKTYDIIKGISSEYKEQMKWLIPWPGDWHILLNYQKALMKAYADAGLMELGKTTQHRSETLTSLMQCTNFRRTHNFILQSMEAFYRFFLSLYLRQQSSTPDIVGLLKSLVLEFGTLSDDTQLDSFRDKVTATTAQFSLSSKDFISFMEALCQKQDTIRFWYQFIAVDMMAYFGLYLAIRYRNWQLRNVSIKLLAAIFSAFDRPVYQRLIPTHIRDILTLPHPILCQLEKGSFCVRLTKTEWHGIGLDECHEMKINKDAKMAVVRPSATKMEYLSHYLPFQAACVNNFHKQLFPEREKHSKKFSHSPTSQDKKTTLNIDRMIEAITAHGLFYEETENNGLWNVFKGIKATNEQTHDLLNFREIGQSGYESYIQSKLLNLPSTHAPVRRKKLCTFSSSSAEKRRIKLVEKEAKINQRYLKKTVAWLAENGREGRDLDMLLGPPSPLPKALMDKDGLPFKSTKSTVTTFLERRYTNPPIITNTLPPQWIPHSTILEGMFMIQVSPLPTMSCMEEYAKLLLSIFVRPHFRTGAIEVHVVFDSPGTQKESPKEIEQYR